MSYQILTGDVLAMLRTLSDESVNCVVTSPPYFGLRDYGNDGQIGLEKTPKEFIGKLTDVFREVRRVLTKDGTCWVNMGDSFASKPCGTFNGGGFKDSSAMSGGRDMSGVVTSGVIDKVKASGLKEKDLMGIPWRLAFALQDDGWYLRSEIIWAKPNPMPESVTDRPTKAHEQIFLLTKSARYAYNADAIKEESIDPESHKGRGKRNGDKFVGQPGSETRSGFANVPAGKVYATRNARTVWTIATEPYPGAHFAVFPSEIPKRCILAGCPEHGTVLDPFAGSGTTLAVAVSLGRKAIGIELNPEYVKLIEERMRSVTPSLFGVAS